MLIKEFSGELTGKNCRFAIILGRFNSFVSEALLKGALDCLERHEAEKVDVYRVPGCFEIPFAAKKIIESRENLSEKSKTSNKKSENEKQYDAVICLGVLIRGETPHFDFVANECSKGIAQIMLQTGVYCSFGIVTTENLEQAIDRAGTKAGNKGFDAAMAAIEMINLQRKI